LTLALRQELREVTKVRVRTGGVCHRHPESERWLFTLRDHEAQAFIKALQIRCEDEGCMCCGSHTFEFYRKNQLVAQCSWHHGETLRWHKETGEENQRLVLASKRYLKKLLKPYEGVPY